MLGRAVLLVIAVAVSGVGVYAQQRGGDDSVVELKAMVFLLQTKLAAIEKELGQEKARRAELELAELQRARETLDPAIKRKLGLPVPDAPKPEQTPVTPPKE